MRKLIPACGVLILALYGAIDESVVMFMSAVAAGIVVYFLSFARIRDRIIAVLAAALGGAIATEIVHTIYYHTKAADPVADSGDLFLSAIILGLVNAAIVVVLVVVTEAAIRLRDPGSE